MFIYHRPLALREYEELQALLDTPSNASFKQLVQCKKRSLNHRTKRGSPSKAHALPGSDGPLSLISTIEPLVGVETLVKKLSEIHYEEPMPSLSSSNFLNL